MQKLLLLLASPRCTRPREPSCTECGYMLPTRQSNTANKARALGHTAHAIGTKIRKHTCAQKCKKGRGLVFRSEPGSSPSPITQHTHKAAGFGGTRIGTPLHFASIPGSLVAGDHFQNWGQKLLDFPLTWQSTTQMLQCPQNPVKFNWVTSTMLSGGVGRWRLRRARV